MKLFRSGQLPEVNWFLVLIMIMLLVFLAPIVIIAGFCWIVFCAITGRATHEIFGRRKPRRRKGQMYQDGDSQDNGGNAASEDEAIECEVISARTLDENGQEIH